MNIYLWKIKNLLDLFADDSERRVLVDVLVVDEWRALIDRLLLSIDHRRSDINVHKTWNRLECLQVDCVEVIICNKRKRLLLSFIYMFDPKLIETVLSINRIISSDEIYFF